MTPSSSPGSVGADAMVKYRRCPRLSALVVGQGALQILAGFEPHLAVGFEAERERVGADLVLRGQAEDDPSAVAHRVRVQVADEQRDLGGEVERAQVDIGGEEQTHQGAVGQACAVGGRHRRRFGQHDEPEEQQRRAQQQLAGDGQQVHGTEDDEPEGRDGHRHEERPEQVEPPELAHEQQAAHEDDRQHRRGAHPPAGRLPEDQRSDDHAEGRGVEEVLLAHRQQILRAHGPHGGPAEQGEVLERLGGLDDQGQDQGGDGHRLGHAVHVQEAAEERVDEPRHRQQEHGGEDDVEWVVGEHVDGAEPDRGDEGGDQVVEGRPVHRHPVEDAVDAGHHGCGTSNSAKPLVIVAMPSLSIM